MSNALAIAAVTTTLRSLLHGRLGVSVTARPLDKARNGAAASQVNLFLYHTTPDAALRNLPMPHQVKPGESGEPPLALTLFYLVTAYGQNDDDIPGHTLLGQAMSILHDHPLLGSAEIRDATQADLAESDLHNQIERVRITPQEMSLDDMSKLWMTFKAEYRISAAYQVSVVLIESTRATKTPLPVLTRGSEDRGVGAQPNLVPPFPGLQTVSLPGLQPSALLGDDMTISGFNLDGANPRVRLVHPFLEPDRVLTPKAGTTPTATKIIATIPDEPGILPAGFYSVSVEVTRPGEAFSRRTNNLVFALAPQISSPMPMNVARVDGDATINLTCRPDVFPGQRASLLIGDREVLADAHVAKTNALVFKVVEAPAGNHFMRLRIDGVDSHIFSRADEDALPIFDQTQRVTIT